MPEVRDVITHSKNGYSIAEENGNKFLIISGRGSDMTLHIRIYDSKGEIAHWNPGGTGGYAPELKSAPILFNWLKSQVKNPIEGKRQEWGLPRTPEWLPWEWSK